MRYLLLSALLVSMHFLLAHSALAQCAAVNIPSLPVTNQAASCHASNQITATNIQGTCGAGSTLYLGGNEALHTVTPTVTGSHTITYTGQTWTSIWVYSTACPTQTGSVCIGSVSSAGSTQTLTVVLTAGVQYWIMFDTYPAPQSPCPGTFSISVPTPPGAACGTTVYDPGGAAGNYPNGANFTQTYCPANPGDVVTLNFSQFGTEACCDFLTIYNGNSTAAPVIGTYSGANSPGIITSTAANGCLTIRFTSDGSVTGIGWAAAVTCGAAPPPPNFCGTTVYDPGGAAGNYPNGANFTQTYCPANPGDVVTLNFSQFGTEACCDFLFIYNGNSTAAPLIGTYSGANSPGVITSTAANGCLTIRFTSDGSISGVGWTAAVICGVAPPPPDPCGTSVYDPGGPGSNYGNNVTYVQTYCPTVPGEAVSLNFLEFGTEGCCDFLYIYNGNSTAAPLIGTYSGTNSPGVVTSTAANGCLTIRFTSDGSITGPGWNAIVSCGEAADCIYLLTLRDSWGDGWGSSNVGVSINGGPFQYYTVTGSQNVVPIVANVGDVVILTYSNTGPFQGENSFSVSLLGAGVVYASSSPPTAGFQPPLTLDCVPPPSPPQDCVGGVTICSGQAFNNNSNNTGNVVDLNTSNQGCLSSGERQGTWYFFSPSSGGTIGFTIAPSAAIDYDFALWGPLTAVTCPPVGPPLRCSYSAQTGPTGLGNGATDFTEGVGGDRWVAPINVIEGQVYVLYIDNFSSTGQAFDLSWQLTNGASLDCTILPLDILHLDAEPASDHVRVSWTSQMGQGEDAYRVERSADGENFHAIGSMNCGGGSPSSTAYTFLDREPIRGWNHYRLVLVSGAVDGPASNVVSALWGRGLAPTVVPNPASEQARMMLREPLPKGSSMRITDAAGQIVWEQFVPSDVTHVDLDLSRFVAGSYILILTGPSGGPLGSTRFVKL